MIRLQLILLVIFLATFQPSMTQDVMLDSKQRLTKASEIYLRPMNIALTTTQLKEMQNIENLYDSLSITLNEYGASRMSTQCAEDLHTVVEDMNTGQQYAIRSKWLYV